jgi:hypothetical protein
VHVLLVDKDLTGVSAQDVEGLPAGRRGEPPGEGLWLVDASQVVQKPQPRVLDDVGGVVIVEPVGSSDRP